MRPQSFQLYISEGFSDRRINPCTCNDMFFLLMRFCDDRAASAAALQLLLLASWHSAAAGAALYRQWRIYNSESPRLQEPVDHPTAVPGVDPDAISRRLSSLSRWVVGRVHLPLSRSLSLASPPRPNSNVEIASSLLPRATGQA